MTPTCPLCGAAMRRRNGRHGPFYGCSKFPGCRGTRPGDWEPNADDATDSIEDRNARTREEPFEV